MATTEKEARAPSELREKIAEKEAELRALREELEEWREDYDGVPKRDELFTTVSGREVKPLYTPLDRADAEPYSEALGFPGEYPFTRGPYHTMYRTRLWTKRQFAGFGTAEETNERYHYLLDHGQTGLSVAFDFPTLMGYDSDHPRSEGEVGVCGVAVSSLRDMETLFRGIPLDEVSVSMTINGPAIILFCFYVAAAERQGVDPEVLRGTVQNDILKEYQAQHAWVFPPRPGAALHRGHVRLVQRERAPLQPDLDLRLPHPGGRGHRRPGARLHPPERLRVRGAGHRAGPRRRRLRAPAVVLLRRPQRLLRGGGQVPGRPPDLGPGHEGGVRRHQPRVLAPPDPRPDGRRDAHRPAAREQHRPGRLPGSGRRPRGHPVPAYELHGRGPGPAHRQGRADRPPDPAGPGLRERGAQHDRSPGRLLLRGEPHRRARGRRHAPLRGDRRGGRRGPGHRGRLVPAEDRRVGPASAGRGRVGTTDRGRDQRLHRGQRGHRDRHPQGRPRDGVQAAGAPGPAPGGAGRRAGRAHARRARGSLPGRRQPGALHPGVRPGRVHALRDPGGDGRGLRRLQGADLLLIRDALVRLAGGRRPSARTLAVVSAACLLFGLLDALQLQVYRGFRGGSLTFAGAVARNLPFWVLWIPLAFVVLRLGGRLPVVGEGKGRRIAAHAVLATAIGALHVALWVVARELLAHGHFRPAAYPANVGKFLAERIGVDLLVYALLVTAAGRHLWAVARPASAGAGGDPPGVGEPDRADFGDAGEGDRLVLRAGGRVYVILRSRVEWVEAEGDYMRLHGDRELLIRITLKELDSLLGSRFVRVSRSALVNVDHLREVRPAAGDRHEAVLASGVRVPVTPSYRERLEDPLGTPL